MRVPSEVLRCRVDRRKGSATPSFARRSPRLQRDAFTPSTLAMKPPLRRPEEQGVLQMTCAARDRLPVYIGARPMG